MKPNVKVKQEQRIEWLTMGFILACYGLWFLAGTWLFQVMPLFACGLLALMIALHSSLSHEVVHGHPTRSAIINEALIFLPLGLVWPYRRFKALHLRHHNDEHLTDPFDDPESYYQALWQYQMMPTWMQLILKINNCFVGRLILGPLLGMIGLILTDFHAIIDGDRRVRNAWILHGLGLAALFLIVVFWFGMALWLYCLMAWAGQSLISVRTFAEHQWSEHPNGRTIIVERTMLSVLFLNNNLHLVHHKYPQVPWYELPMLYQSRREEWLAMNDHYLMRGYFKMFCTYAFNSKEPVVHPILQKCSLTCDNKNSGRCLSEKCSCDKML